MFYFSCHSFTVVDIDRTVYISEPNGVFRNKGFSDLSLILNRKRSEGPNI